LGRSTPRHRARSTSRTSSSWSRSTRCTSTTPTTSCPTRVAARPTSCCSRR
jgi:hypothetical protein